MSRLQQSTSFERRLQQSTSFERRTVKRAYETTAAADGKEIRLGTDPLLRFIFNSCIVECVCARQKFYVRLCECVDILVHTLDKSTSTRSLESLAVGHNQLLLPPSRPLRRNDAPTLVASKLGVCPLLLLPPDIHTYITIIHENMFSRAVCICLKHVEALLTAGVWVIIDLLIFLFAPSPPRAHPA